MDLREALGALLIVCAAALLIGAAVRNLNGYALVLIALVVGFAGFLLAFVERAHGEGD